MMTQARPRVLMVFGGQSSEHEISCATAAGILSAIDRDVWDIVPVGITKDGQWVRVSDNPDDLEFHDGHGHEVTATGTHVVWGPHGHLFELSDSDEGGQGLRTARDLGAIDVVFPLLHGPYGEDGTIQGLLEMVGVRYVGCGVAASAVCMDKHLTKTVLSQAGVDVGRWELVTAEQWSHHKDDANERIRALGLPLFVKPCRAGSSIGITRVDQWEQLDQAIEEAHAHDPRVIVESMLQGREVECAVLATRAETGERAPARAAVLGEIIVPDGEFYDFNSKYVDAEAATLKCPADLKKTDADRIRDVAIQAFAAVGGEGLSRVDFFFNDSTGAITVNEINTMPGFTPISLYPRMWESSGVDYGQLLDTLLREALARPLGLR